MAKAEHREQPAASAASSEAPRRSLLGRVLGFPRWLLANPVRGSLVVLGVVAIIGAGVGATLVFWPQEKPAYMRQLGQAFASYEAGDYPQARKVAAQLLRNTTVGYSDHGGAYFILGAITLREANQQINPGKRQTLDLVAARYLEEARSRGIPQTREADGLWQLGQALHDAGRFARSVSILREALEEQPDKNAKIHALLADGYVNMQPPRLTEALEHNRLYLAAPGLSTAEIDAGRLVEAQILLAQKDTAGAQAALAPVAATSTAFPQAVILGGRILVEMLQASGIDRESAAATAAPMLEQLQRFAGREGAAPVLAAQAQLLTGLLHQELGQSQAAEADYDRIRRSFFGQPEALAATIFHGDLIRRDRPQEAVALYKRGLNQLAGSDEAYSNLWLPADQFRLRLQTAVDDLAERSQYALALDLAEALIPPFSHTVAVERQATIHEAWARQLEERARSEKPPQLDATEGEARKHWRQAGALWRALADLRVATRYYLSDLGTAADDLRRGQGYEQAEVIYRELLRQEPQQGEPEALVGLGETLLALGKTDEAVATLDRCREAYPKHPSTYRARLLASVALREQGKLPEAQELLIDNLYRFSLTPDSSEWRESLFALGTLLYKQALELESRSRQDGVDRLEPEARRAGLALLEQSHAVFDEAIRTLGEAVERYPTAPQATEARYRMAEAYRHSAKLPRKRLAGVTIETSKAALVRQMQEQLQSAINEYNKLISRLSEVQDVQRWPTEAAILRNCYFGRADALFDLGKYEEAIEAYSAATNRYQHDPESLEAYVQIACCQRRLGRISEARGTLEQARVVLQRINAEANFKGTTRLARQDWVHLLDWLRAL